MNTKQLTAIQFSILVRPTILNPCSSTMRPIYEKTMTHRAQTIPVMMGSNRLILVVLREGLKRREFVELLKMSWKHVPLNVVAVGVMVIQYSIYNIAGLPHVISVRVISNQVLRSSILRTMCNSFYSDGPVDEDKLFHK